MAAAQATRIAVPLVSGVPALPEQIDHALAEGADLIEIRVDLIDDLEAVSEAIRARPDAPLILTIRSSEEGGDWDGDDAERIALIERLGLELPGYVDVEYATWKRSANLRQKVGLVCDTQSGEAINRPLNRLILSHHDFVQTPADLGAVLRNLQSVPSAIAKAVFMPKDAADSLRILATLREASEKQDTIVLGMGEAGLVTRILARKFGGWLTFATLSAERESAPGQPTLEALKKLYRWDSIGPATRVMGVIGWPVGHSKSPALHNAAMQSAGVDGVYVLLPVEPTQEAFERFMASAEAASWMDFAGFSVTLPHKTHAHDWVEENGGRLSAAARRTGAVNTLSRQANGTWSGDNTDVDGILAALSTAKSLQDPDWSQKEIAVLGAGGVSRAIVVAAQSRGASVTILNRNSQRAELLANELGCDDKPWVEREQISCDVLINGTSLGMWPNDRACPVNGQSLRPGMVVFDTIYNPLKTCLIKLANAAGCETVTGDRMFVAQAARQFELWHGAKPNLKVMQAALGL